MKRLIADITDELREIIDLLASDKESPIIIGSLVEDALRSHPRVESLRAKRKINWQDRPGMGRPPKSGDE